MRISQLVVVASAVLCAALVLGQTLPPTLPRTPLPKIYSAPGGGGGARAEVSTFEFGGQKYRVTLPHREILSGPEWNPTSPLPLSFVKVEEIARQDLRKLGAEDEALQLTTLQLQRLRDTAESRWYYAVTFRSALDVRGEPFDRITFLVSLQGQPAQVSPYRSR